MPGEVRLSEISRMLAAKGYRLTRINGSHHVFTKAGARPVPIPVHKGMVKPAYVRMVRKLEA
jgi:predicted RNA binding protein YcfA (HicA-like mRNA interferase family)